MEPDRYPAPYDLMRTEIKTKLGDINIKLKENRFNIFKIDLYQYQGAISLNILHGTLLPIHLRVSRITNPYFHMQQSLMWQSKHLVPEVMNVTF